jgi:hypothetical protein
MTDDGKRYRVVGTQPVMVHEPGSTFVAVFHPGLEEFLIGIGALEVVPGPKPDDEVKVAKRR